MLGEYYFVDIDFWNRNNMFSFEVNDHKAALLIYICKSAINIYSKVICSVKAVYNIHDKKYPIFTLIYMIRIRLNSADSTRFIYILVVHGIARMKRFAEQREDVGI